MELIFLIEKNYILVQNEVKGGKPTILQYPNLAKH